MEGTPWRALWMLGHLVSLVSCDTSCMLQHRHVGPTGIPCTIHQLDTGELSKTSNTWTSMNPECNHKLWNATQVETLVREQSPDLIWPIWDSLSVEERGDVFRYLVIWHQGGWWADSDVACLKPIADFPVPSNATMIVGYEFGHRWSEKQRQEVNFARTEQFAKYFFAAAPRNPVLLRCLRMVRQRFSWKILQTSDFTGSALFSDAVNEFLESDESLNKDSVKRKNMEVHLNKLRMLNLGICARMGVQTQLEDAYWDVLFRACLYVCFSCASFISKRDMSYTIRPLCLCFYIALLGRMWACFDMQQYHANQAYVVGKTCLMATLFVDMWVAIPMGIFISFLDARLFISHGGDLVDNEVSSRVAVLILYIFIPTVAELTARRFIQGLLDAHLMVAGFRKMLKGISDGEFLTDSNFNIHGDAKCLENLLALNAELTGTSFLSWLWDDKEQHAFQQFVWTDKEEESAPGCLRIHLRNSKGQSVALDACHVKVPDLFGAVQPYHLIALKEDPEQVIEDRPDAQVAGSLPPQLLTSDQRSNRAAASSSEGSLCSSCIVDSMKELSEMTFLLDGSSEHFDMLEAHLRFNRVTDDLTSAMPHLRKFARPVDWGWLSNDIAQYIWTGFSQTSVPGPISVGPMFFRMPYDSSRYLLAKHAQLSLASPLFVHGNSEMDQEGDGIDGQAGQASSSPRPIRLYLHLKNFAPGELPHRSNLSGIGEQSDILDESDTSD